MPIYICKNCGNLTEIEEKEGLTCSNCGAPLDEPKRKEEAKPSQPLPTPVSQPAPTQTSSQPLTSDQKPSDPPESRDKHVEPSVLEEPPTEPSPPTQPSPAQPTSESSTLQQAPIELPESKEPDPLTSRPTVAGPPSTQTHAFIGSTHELMEVYENKNLVACPQCGYGCDPAWEKCVVCSAKIAGVPELKKITETSFEYDEKSIEQNLVKCPKCEYACDPKWGNCPLCQTELKPPE